MALIRSKDQLKKNTFHKVLVNRMGRAGQLQVDGSPVLSGESEGTLTSLDLGEFLYLGNVPEEAKEYVHYIHIKDFPINKLVSVLFQPIFAFFK